tara:strand:- start:8 stop:1339 length:1332 start_codon:yes stop_codon:yes gene_type:complete
MDQPVNKDKIPSWSGEGIDGLVDPESGVQSARVYKDEGVFKSEMRKVFGKCWLMLGHESQIPEVGDFITSRMGNDSVLVTRHRDNSIKVMLNQCRHRGVKLERGDFGSSRTFTCSYHGWCYDTEGALVGMPHFNNHGECFKKEEWGLISVPRVETYQGIIFGCWDEEGESLDDYLAESKWYLDAFFDRTEGGPEFIGLQKWRLRGNWKWGAEQHCSDFYHAQVSHVSYVDAFAPGTSINSLMPDGMPPEYGLQYASFDKGHGAGWMTFPDEASMHQPILTQTQEVIDYTRDVLYPTVTERLGETRGQKMAIFHMNIFPNFSMNRGQGYIRLWQPISADEAEVWSFVFVDKNMPQEIKDSYLTAKANIFSVAGGLEQDDSENAQACQMGLTGTVAETTKLNIMMGEDEIDKGDFEGPGQISTVYSEVALRAFYRRWKELMTAAD